MYDLLSGLTIVEASSFVASPTIGLYLAQMGADVIRVDQIGGGPDYKRWPLADNGQSLFWENVNRAKRSVALDLSSGAGRELLQELVVATGQFVTNFPATGFLAHDALAARRADLVTVRVMGQPDGRTALDYSVNAEVGYPFLTGEGPEPVNHVLPAWDLLTGAYGAFAMLAALHHRERTGMGQEMRIPLSDVAVASAANLGMFAQVWHTGETRERLGNQVYGAFGRDFATADGVRVMLLALTPKQWRALVDVLAMADEIAAIEEERGTSFVADEGARFAHRDVIYPLVERKVATWRWDALRPALDAAGACYSIYQTMVEAAADRRLVHDNPLFSLADNPSGAPYPAAGPFANIPGMTRGAAQPAPLLGADTDQVLADVLGLSSGQIGALYDSGTARQA